MSNRSAGKGYLDTAGEQRAKAAQAARVANAAARAKAEADKLEADKKQMDEIIRAGKRALLEQEKASVKKKAGRPKKGASEKS